MKSLCFGILAALFANGVLACSGDPGITESPPPVDHADSSLGSLEQRIVEARERLANDHCSADLDPSDCPTVNVRIDGSDERIENGSNEAILIVDEFDRFSTWAFLQRYRHRVRALLQLTATGVDRVSASWPIPQSLATTLEDFSDPAFIPAAALQPIGEEIEKRFSPYSVAHHGQIVSAMTVDLAPRNPIVFLDGNGPEWSGIPMDRICREPNSPALLSELTSRFKQTADAIRNAIAEYNIKYVNVSSGVVIPSPDKWATRCQTPAPSREVLRNLYETMRPLYRAYFGTPGVIATNAGYYNDPLTSPFDLPSADFPNRVRVGVIESVDSGAGPEGSEKITGINIAPRQSEADAFFVWGCETLRRCNATPPMIVWPLGMGIEPLVNQQRPGFFGATSWVSPMALARVVNLRETKHAGAEFNDSLVATLKDEFTPRACGPSGSALCQFQDPYRHGQFEFFRLGYGKYITK
ncbi:hypothetical protein LVJ94_25805 [Pendulispora rubella]|uniref:Uncharacterized protein n=1 Tax=Pendulispora rubella TaxID=2741070 RepID=A0ABZ2LI56_9BACT